jgi:hypothetical protein
VTVGYAGGGALNLRNSLNGATQRTDFNIGNDISAALLDIATYSSGYTPGAGFDLPNSTLFYHAGAGGLAFYLANGSAAFSFWTGGTKRLSIPGSGELLVNAAAPVQNCRVLIASDSSVNNSLVLQNYNGAAGGFFQLFLNSGAGVAGSISHSGSTSIAFNTTSDARLKIDHGRATNLEALRGVVVHDFRWKADGRWDRGVFAQDAAAVFPRAVTEGTDDRTESGDLARPWMTDYSKFVPDLIAGWQQHDAALAQLRAELAALKG